ncbi:2-hydroxyacid dehydrogenase [Paraglaciecola aquimarina]|uniref:2-hydroxyacid dehydrogenase n=1 Tax=Paraglaciecola aquimarina TaxID=1235557 RepID=A0ABU3SVT1_9ALTE|nr:2-hydroxyacid dehydrogenase [Paraglaciecola aquimarina]MDU0354101.1 2-hydroxyacid dehydrogenase [Paraglaciecola aquimarina]
MNQTAPHCQVAFFSSKRYDKQVFSQFTEDASLELLHIEARLDENTVPLATGSKTICVFVNDELNTQVVIQLAELGVKHIALRCAGYNNVDIATCHQLGISVSHVPVYSPHAIAEHAMALILTLNRRTHKAYNRVKEGNFDLQGLLGFTLHNKTIGVIGTGHIGRAFVNIANGFGCRVLAYDPKPNPALEAVVEYTDLAHLLGESDIISLHCPLTKDNHHLINQQNIALMKNGVMLINTSRGALIDTGALVKGLKSQKIGYVGLDVYEMESELFFRDRSCEVIQDDLFQRLSTFHNVLITGHQGFFSQEALNEIAQTTVDNIKGFLANQINAECFL